MWAIAGVWGSPGPHGPADNIPCRVAALALSWITEMACASRACKLQSDPLSAWRLGFLRLVARVGCTGVTASQAQPAPLSLGWEAWRFLIRPNCPDARGWEQRSDMLGRAVLHYRHPGGAGWPHLSVPRPLETQPGAGLRGGPWRKAAVASGSVASVWERRGCLRRWTQRRP